MGSVPDVAPELDELLITIVVDNATDTVSSIGPGLPQLLELAAIFESVASSRQHDGHDCGWSAAGAATRRVRNWREPALAADRGGIETVVDTADCSDASGHNTISLAEAPRIGPGLARP
jgi:hypothetical protein